jgi:hypothetical protein
MKTKGITYVIYQYSETNVTHFLLSLSRIKGLYIFPALLAHPQEVLHKRHLVYCMCCQFITVYVYSDMFC